MNVEAPATSETAADPEASLWEDFVDVYLAPRELFRRRRDGRFVPALIVVTLVLSLFFLASLGPLGPAMEGEMMRGMQAARDAGQPITPEQTEQLRAMSGAIGAVSLLVTVPLSALILGALVWILARLLDVALAFVVAITISTYSIFPRVIQSAATVVQALLFEPSSLAALSLGPARLLDPATASPVLLALLLRLDLFVIWSAILIGVGLAVTTGVSRPRAIAAAVAIWLLAALPAFLGVIASG